MEQPSRLHLFAAYGVELEYMIVDSTTLNVKPIAEVLLKDDAGNIQGEIEHGITARSNELVSHVIELKSNGPTSDLVGLHAAFKSQIQSINNQLRAHNAVLMPGAAHPWMNPAIETKLWEHESQEIYHLYDRIFNCKGHGWSNLQSTHINLPFYDDEEFAKLHTAIRFLLPIIPALTAASPILDGKFTGYLDKRLYYYEKNQSKIPILTGKVIPEKLFSKHQYQKHVYERIAKAIEPFDPDHLLKPIWLNSRGAMARFDRGAIEIRIIDIQESPLADLGIVALITQLVKLLVRGKLVSFEAQQAFETDDLHLIFRDCIKYASNSVITDSQYLEAWGHNAPTRAGDLWQWILPKVSEAFPETLNPWMVTLEQQIMNGSLAERIMKSLDNKPDPERLFHVYKTLTKHLHDDSLFLP